MRHAQIHSFVLSHSCKVFAYSIRYESVTDLISLENVTSSSISNNEMLVTYDV